ncbi:MAG: LPS export ABC transporter permease LptF [Pseudomonadota bacterium]
MTILSKYIARDVVAAIASVAIILLLIILGKLFIQLLDKVLDGSISADMLGTVLLLGLIRYLVILLPFSFFMAIIMVISRMYKDSEVNAAKAGGASSQVFVQGVMMIGIPIIIVLYLLVSYVSPWASRLSATIESVTEQSMVLGQLSPGKFFELESSGWVIYVESQDPDTNELHDVFMQREQDGKLIVETSRVASIKRDKDRAQIFVLEDGRVLEGIPGEANYSNSTYREHRLYPPQTDFSRKINREEYQDIHVLLDSDDPRYSAELWQRYSIIISTILLMLLAIPLSKVQPNTSRFARMGLAALIYVLYLNLVVLSCSWIKREETIGYVSLFLVHALVLFVTYLMYDDRLIRGIKRKWAPQ